LGLVHGTEGAAGAALLSMSASREQSFNSGDIKMLAANQFVLGADPEGQAIGQLLRPANRHGHALGHGMAIS